MDNQEMNNENINTIDENNEDPYKDYYTTNIFEGLKKANPKVLVIVGVVAIVLVVAIILIFGGNQKVSQAKSSLADDYDYDDGYDYDDDDYDYDDDYDDDDDNNNNHDYDDYDDDYDDEDDWDIRKRPYRNIELFNGMEVTEESYTDEYGDKDDFFNIGEQGRISFLNEDDDDYYDYYDDGVYAPPGRRSSLSYDPYEGEKITYTNDNPSVVRIDENTHTYTIVGGGKAKVTATMGTKTATYLFIASNDLSGVTLEKQTVTIYRAEDYSSGSGMVKLVGAPDMTYGTTNSGHTVSGGMEVSVSLDRKEKAIIFYSDEEGECDIEFFVNGRIFTIHIVSEIIKLNATTKILDKGKSFTLKLKGFKEKPEWKSTDPKVATANSSGKVKGKKIGNAIIYVDMAGTRVGCLVSVVKKGVAKACKRAAYIGKHWKYSQPKRMKKGYYDCSSLVWKSYKAGGKYVGGAKSYAPTAAELCKWCNKSKKRKLGKFKWNKVSKLKYLPGDLLFLTGKKNGRYKNVYHVEMITGYQFYGFNGKTPIVELTWGARGVGYGGSSSDYMGRPFS